VAPSNTSFKFDLFAVIFDFMPAYFDIFWQFIFFNIDILDIFFITVTNGFSEDDHILMSDH